MAESEDVPAAAPGTSFPGSAPSANAESVGDSATAATAAADAADAAADAAPSSPNAWARFEFQTGCGNEGTKVLMVEWDPAGDGGDGDRHATSEQHQRRPPSARDHGGGWEVSWPGKATTFPVSEREGGSANQRVFFLIPPHHSVPPTIQISQLSTGRTLRTKPMPAIYMPALGVDTTKEAGRRGVLHTIWAKKRVLQLEDEINQEIRENSEGVALHMAVEERDLLAQEFGLDNPSGAPSPRAPRSTTPPTPRYPKSPTGGKLGEKLRGLKLATSPAELANPGDKGQRHHLYSLSPDTSDIAVPSRSAFAASSATPAAGEPGPGVASLNAIIQGGNPTSQRPPLDGRGTEDELFALPMSPRSPEMKKSPFSIL